MLPIVHREMQVAARRRATFVFRTIAAGVGLFVAFVTWMDTRANNGDMTGKNLLWPMALIGCVMAVREGCVRAAKSLSEERANGTLGLLFLTPLKRFDVVFGKFATAALLALQMALTLAPILALTILLGGVSMGEVARASLWIANLTFCFVAGSLLVSALTASEFAAMTIALAFIGIVCACGWYDIALYQRSAWPFGPLLEIYVNPIASWLGIDDVRYRGHTELYWSGMLVGHLVGWLMLWFTAFALKRNWQKAVVFPKLAILWTKPPPRARKKRRSNALGKLGPLEWLMLRNVYIEAPLLLVLFCFLSSLPLGDRDGMYFLSFFALLILIFGVTVHAPLAVAQARKAGMLDLLAVAPIGDREIVIGQMRGLRKMFLGAAILALLWFAMFLPWKKMIGNFASGHDLSAWMPLYYAATIPLTLWAASYTGIWMALKSKGPVGAVTRNAILSLVLPWVLPVPSVLYLFILGCISREIVQKDFRKLLAGRTSQSIFLPGLESQQILSSSPEALVKCASSA